MAKLNKSTSTSKKMKQAGAGYSTTNRKGVQTFYKSAKDAPGYSDTQDGKNVPVSKGKPIGTSTITSDKIKPVTPIVLPKPGAIDPMKGTMEQNNANLGGLSGYDFKTNQFVAQPEDPNKRLYDQINTMIGDQESLPSAESYVNKQQKYLKPKEDLVNSLQGQINTISASRDAEMLKLEGQGRGQTTGFIGGEQGRISREAAIQALPIQAQLASAQGDLDSARTYASQLFQAQMQDAQNQYNFRKEVHSTIFNYLNEQEKRQLALKDKEDDRAFQLTRDNTQRLENLADKAMEYGYGSKLGAIMALDPKSPTFSQDYSRVASGIQKPVSVTAPKAPDLQNFGTSDNPDWRQYNPSTGGWDEVAGVGGATGSTLSKVQRAKVSDSLTANKELYQNIQEYKNLLDDVGFEGTTWGASNLGKFDALRGRITTTLKKAETLGTLDAGVLQLVDQLIGQRPEKGGFTQNFLGFGSRRVSSSLNQQLKLIDQKIKIDEERLGGGKQFSLTSADLSELDELFGEMPNSTNSGFDPSEYF